MLLTETPTTRTLAVNVTYGGANGLNEHISINEVTILYAPGKVTTKLVNPVEIRGNTHVVLPINDADESRGHIRSS